MPHIKGVQKLLLRTEEARTEADALLLQCELFQEERAGAHLCQGTSGHPSTRVLSAGKVQQGDLGASLLTEQSPKNSANDF